jgi:TonB family protein
MRSRQYSIKLPFLIVALAALTIPTMLAVHAAFAQAAWTWVVVKPPGENFSVRMPKQPSQEPVEMPNMPNLTGTAYSATGGRIYYTVKSIHVGRAGSPESRLNDFIAKYRASLAQANPGPHLSGGSPIFLNGFGGQQFSIIAQNGRGLVRIYSTMQRIYVLEVSGGDEEDAPVGWFLNSFIINEPAPIERTGGGGDDRRGGGDKGTGNNGGGAGGGGRPPIYTQCACDPLGSPVEESRTDYLPTHDAVICTKGELELTDEAIKHQFNGDVILDVELLKDGTVGAINVVQSQPYGLDQKAIEYAQQYKFCPAMQDGQLVDQRMNVTCQFRVRMIYRKSPAPTPRGRRRP